MRWGLHSLRLCVDELGGLCDGSRLLHARIGDLCTAEFQVALDGAAEQNALLGHIAQQAVELLLRHLPHIDAIDGHAAAGDIIKAGDEVEQAGFAAAGGADDGCGLAGVCGKADVLQRVAVGTGEAEADILEPDHAIPVLLFKGGLCGGSVGIMDGSLGAADLVDTVSSHTGTGKHHATMASIRKDMTICMV